MALMAFAVAETEVWTRMVATTDESVDLDPAALPASACGDGLSGGLGSAMGACVFVLSGPQPASTNPSTARHRMAFFMGGQSRR